VHKLASLLSAVVAHLCRDGLKAYPCLAAYRLAVGLDRALKHAILLLAALPLLAAMRYLDVIDDPSILDIGLLAVLDVALGRLLDIREVSWTHYEDVLQQTARYLGVAKTSGPGSPSLMWFELGGHPRRNRGDLKTWKNTLDLLRTSVPPQDLDPSKAARILTTYYFLLAATISGLLLSIRLPLALPTATFPQLITSAFILNLVIALLTSFYLAPCAAEVTRLYLINAR
jgi:hypothetical protein